MQELRATKREKFEKMRVRACIAVRGGVDLDGNTGLTLAPMGRIKGFGEL
jgi:hypothetical protein